MTHIRPDPEPPTQATGATSGHALALRVRAVHRAMAELRRGVPIVLAGSVPLLVLAAETAGAEGLAELDSLRAGPALLLLAATRAAGVLGRPVQPADSPVALRLTENLFSPAALRSLADPTAERLLELPEQMPLVPPGSEAALALAKLARLLPACIVAPLHATSLHATRAPNLLSVTEAEIREFPASLATNLVQVAATQVALEGAPDARLVAFRGPDAGIEHLAILVGRPEDQPAPLARLHSECFTGDLLGSLRCDCGPQLRHAIRRMGEEGHGVLLYLSQEGRGIGLVNKLRAYVLQDQGLDTLDANRALGWGADERNFMLAAGMLHAVGISAVRLLTNNPRKLEALAACGVEVVGRVPHAFAPNGVNDRYLATKAERFGHLLDLKNLS